MTSLFNNIQPIFAILTGYLLLGEVFGTIQLVGDMIVLIGVYITKRNLQKNVFTNLFQCNIME